MINGLPIGNAGGALEQYYIDNIIAGGSGTTDAFTQPAASFGDISTSLQAKLANEITAGVEIASVPEPTSTMFIGLSGMLLILRRNR